jgi:ABC-type nitrate/sulfonate/bicarbonate transport system substrate-binding protein
MTESRKIRDFWITAAVVATLMASSFEAAAADVYQLKISTYGGGTTFNLPDTVAREKGFFKRHNIEPVFSEIPSAPASVSAGLSGRLDVFVASPLVGVAAQQKGACIRFLTADQYFMFNIIAQKDLNLPNKNAPFPKQLADLKGKTVGLAGPKGAAAYTMLADMFKRAGLDPEKDLTIIGMAGATPMMAAFKAKRVDAIMELAPIRGQLGSENYVMLANLAGKIGTPYQDYLVAGQATTCDFAKKNPEALKNYCRALGDAYDFIKDPKNEEEMVKLLAQKLGVSDKVALEAWPETRSTLRNARISKEIWEAQAQYIGEAIGGAEKLPAYKDAVWDVCVADGLRPTK